MDFDGALRICESTLRMPEWASMHRLYGMVAGCADAGRGAHESALEHLLAARRDMEQQPLIDDWLSRMPLQWGFTEASLAKGDLAQARLEAEQFLEVTLVTEERTWRALAFEANARVAIAEGDLQRTKDYITRAVQEMEGFEVPLAAWRVHATASELYERIKKPDLAKKHRELSRATVTKLANSLPIDEPLRKTFLSAPLIQKILGKEKLSARKA
jgi:hypothetical protein